METIGGYRIIRKLGSGARSEVYLGHAAPTGGSAARLAAIKVFKAGVSATSIDGEIGALSRLQNEHVVSLLDLATTQTDAPCLVLQRLTPGGLPALLAERRALQPGEAVTMLAPLIATVASMHREGVVHGKLGVQAIHFDDAGAPMLAGFGTAACFAIPGAATSEAALESEPLVLADRHALLALVASVMDRSSVADASVDEFTRWLVDRQGRSVDLTELEQRIFDIADPVAVNFTDSVPPATEWDRGVPSRFGNNEGLVDQEHQRRPDAQRPNWGPVEVTGRKADWLSALPPELASWISGRLTDVSDWTVTRVAALQHQVRTVRRRMWVVASIGLVAVAVAVVITSLPAKAGDVVTPPSAEAPPPVTSTVTRGDDPVAAAGELLTLRARCLADRSILCLDTVHAPDSASWRADAARIRDVQGGAELSPDAFPAGSPVTLVDRLGQTALVALSQEDATPANATASVLLIRTEAGWRFRSLLAGSMPLGDALP